ncbi:MAG: DUF5522 domain-containing protein [Candidatus Sumerlaeia bacterium]|nr:DUF5522 domain-containing protein [Candidatus Sumerlaeia bacterium]
MPPFRRGKAPKIRPDDYYMEGDVVVFNESYHLRRGYCCLSACRHCPWRKKAQEARAQRTKTGTEDGSGQGQDVG